MSDKQKIASYSLGERNDRERNVCESRGNSILKKKEAYSKGTPENRGRGGKYR